MGGRPVQRRRRMEQHRVREPPPRGTPGHRRNKLNRESRDFNSPGSELREQLALSSGADPCFARSVEPQLNFRASVANRAPDQTRFPCALAGAGHESLRPPEGQPTGFRILPCPSRRSRSYFWANARSLTATQVSLFRRFTRAIKAERRVERRGYVSDSVVVCQWWASRRASGRGVGFGTLA